MRTIFLFLLFSFYLLTHAQQKPIVIPFTLTKHNNLAVPAILNNKDTVLLMFHTAASDLTLVEESVKRLTSLHFNGADTLKSWGGNNNTARFSPDNTLRVGGLSREKLSIWENKYSGPGTDGKFGPDLFKDKAIEIDFDKRQIVLHASLPSKTSHYTKLRATLSNDMLFVEATCNTGSDTISNRFLIHSGYSGGVLLDDQFVADHKLGAKLKVTDTQDLKDSYGNIVKSRKAILPGFTLGNTTLTNVQASFFEGALGRQKISAIGGDILRRFNIIIDAQRTFVYLKPNKEKPGPLPG